jgi:hypothetical protein
MDFKFNSNPEIEAYLAGVISGDGYLHKNFIQIDGDSKEWLETVSRFFQELFGKKGKLVAKQNSKGARLYLSSREISKHFNNEWCIPFGNKSSIITPPVDKLQEPDAARAYLIGWFDSECHVEHWRKPNTNKTYLRIQFKTKSKPIRDFLAKILQDCNITISSYKDCENSYRIQIGSRNSIEAFENNFFFIHPNKNLNS